MATTLNKLIYDISNTIYQGVTPDEFSISKRQLADWIHIERAVILKQEIQKFNKIPNQLVQDLGCVELECVDKLKCALPEGVSSGDYIHRTVKEIPKTIEAPTPINKNPNPFVYIGFLNGNPIELTTINKANWAKYKKYTSNRKRGFIKDNKIYITNLSQETTINIQGIFENPEEVSGFLDENGKPCFDYDSSYPILQQHRSLLFQMIMEKRLKHLLQSFINRDFDNNSKQEFPSSNAVSTNN